MSPVCHVIMSALCVKHAGPVFVEFPIDTLYPYKLVAHEAGLTAGKTIAQKLVNMCVLCRCISVCLSVCLSVSLSVCLSVSLYRFIVALLNVSSSLLHSGTDAVMSVMRSSTYLSDGLFTVAGRRMQNIFCVVDN